MSWTALSLALLKRVLLLLEARDQRALRCVCRVWRQALSDVSVPGSLSKTTSTLAETRVAAASKQDKAAVAAARAELRELRAAIRAERKEMHAFRVDVQELMASQGARIDVLRVENAALRYIGQRPDRGSESEVRN
jgi:hypothetical protein